MRAALEFVRRVVEAAPRGRVDDLVANPGLRQVAHAGCGGRWRSIRIPCEVGQCPTPHPGVECDRCGTRVDLVYRIDPRGEWTP